jgi:chromate transporter
LLASIALLFLRLGTLAFGGPAAHIAMMEDEVVTRRRWLTREQFLDFVGATNLIPGPNSTELAIHIGFARAGWPGLVVAGTCFILPAALIVSGIAWIYVRFGTLPAVEGVLYGVKPVVIAVVLQALWRLGRTAIASRLLAGLALVAVIAFAAGVHELAVLGGAGVIVALARAVQPGDGKRSAESCSVAPFVIREGANSGWMPAATVAAVGTIPFSLGVLFGTFVKIGAVLFGSGYVLLAFLRKDFVERLGWLTETQLLDAIAVGQMTPGPIFTTATFVGYLLGGAGGAAVATAGIFLPAFVFVALTGVLVRRLRESRVARAVLDGVNVASLALMGVVTWQLGSSALVDLLAIALALASCVLLFRRKVNSAWLVLGGAVIGLAVHH